LDVFRLDALIVPEDKIKVLRNGVLIVPELFIEEELMFDVFIVPKL